MASEEDEAVPLDPAVQLEWVLGVNPSAVHALRAPILPPEALNSGSSILSTTTASAGGAGGMEGLRVAYMSGNVGIIFDTVSKTQTLLRGHRNPLRACVVTPDKTQIVTACAGAASSIIFWDANAGTPVAMIESPHSGGTMAMGFSVEGRYLVTLSVPSSSSSSSSASSSVGGIQEICIWDCEEVTLLSQYHHHHHHQRTHAPTVHLVASAVVPISEEQTSISVSSHPLPLPLHKLKDPQTPSATAAAAVAIAATLQNGSSSKSTPNNASSSSIPPMTLGGVLTGGFEIVTTGVHSTIFWVATRTAIKDEEAASSVLKKTHHLGNNANAVAKSGIDVSSIQAAAREVTKDIWNLVYDVPSVPKAPPSGLIDPSTGRPLPPEKRVLKTSLFLPGHFAHSLGTVDDNVVELASTGLLGALAGGGAGNATNNGGSSSSSSTTTATGSGAGAVKALRNKEVLVPSTGSFVVAASATNDGSLLLWRISPSSAMPTLLEQMKQEEEKQNNFGFTSIADAALRLTRKTYLKVVKLTVPVSSTAAIDGGAPSTENAALNVLLASPSGRHLLVGSNDGGVCIYDLHFRLVAWFDKLNAGGVTALSFIPDTGPANIDAFNANMHTMPQQGGGHNAGIKPISSLVPDLAIVTSRSLVLSVALQSFDLGDHEMQKGNVLLEGPDAFVTGVAAYPSSAALALAVASGCVQLWDYTTKTLLLVRELARANDGLGNKAHVPGAPQLPPFYTPTAIAVDPRQRFVGVGTSEGAIFILDPADLSDAQPPLPHPQWPRPIGAGTAITRMVFSEDGYHLAVADEAQHVALYRFYRQRERRLVPGMKQANATTRLHSRRPWEDVVDDAGRYEEVIVDSWIYIGRAKSHGNTITGLSFSHLPLHGKNKHNTDGAIAGHEGPHFWMPGTILGDAAVAARHEHTGLCQLASVGADRRIVMYDVGSASIQHGLQLRGSQQRVKCEQFATPTCCLFEPPSANANILTADQASAAAVAIFSNGDGSSSGGDVGGEHAGGGGGGGDGDDTAAAVLSSAAVLAGAKVLTGARLTVATDAFKFKQWAVGAGAPLCTSIMSGPSFGGAVTHMAFLSKPSSSSSSSSDGSGSSDGTKTRKCFAMAYATSDRVVGVVGTPLNGNPFAVAGVVGHTGPVCGLAASFDGSYLFTAGQDSTTSSSSSSSSYPSGSVCIWLVSDTALAKSTAAGGANMAPYLSLLEGGGAGGMQYAEICDIFSYAQIHAQGEASTAPRRAGVTLPVAELPAVMRALGYFPTAAELTTLLTEARLAAAGSGLDVESVDLSTVIKLFVNYRPLGRPGREQVLRAMQIILQNPASSGETDGAGSIRWGGLANILATHGEVLGAQEVSVCLRSLLGSGEAGGNTSSTTNAASGSSSPQAKGNNEVEEPLLEDDELVSGEDVADRLLQL